MINYINQHRLLFFVMVLFQGSLLLIADNGIWGGIEQLSIGSIILWAIGTVLGALLYTWALLWTRVIIHYTNQHRLLFFQMLLFQGCLLLIADNGLWEGIQELSSGAIIPWAIGTVLGALFYTWFLPIAKAFIRVYKKEKNDE